MWRNPAGRMANSADLDQTALTAARWSGSMLIDFKHLNNPNYQICSKWFNLAFQTVSSGIPMKVHFSYGFWYKLSLVMIKPAYAICKQQRCRSACTSAQSDQRLCWSLPRLYNISSFYFCFCSWAAGLSLTWSKLPKTGFLMMWLNSLCADIHVLSECVSAVYVQK